jgi:hypothetical protein
VNANLVNNFSFEDEYNSWQKTNSSISFSLVNNEAVEGSRSALIKNQNTSSYGVKQVIANINRSLTYKFYGYIKIAAPQTQKALFRLAWYKSNDGTGSQFSTNDAYASATISDWQKIELIKSPPSDEIRSAEIRLLVASGSAYFDEIYFEEYVVPTTTPTASADPILPSLSVLTPKPTFFSTPTPTPTPTPISYSSIYLSEVMVYPLSGEKEWAEIYNDNDFLVNLDNWYIDDIENAGATEKKFSLTVGPKSYAVIEFSSAIFNNDDDQVRLLDFNKIEKDSFEYSQSMAGKSWGRVDFNSDFWCLQEPTKGRMNGSCLSNSTNTNKKSIVTLIPSPTATNNKFPKTNFSQAKTIKKRAAKKIEDYVIRDNNYFLSSQKGEVLGEEIENKTKKPQEIFLLPLIYSLTSTILSLKKILEQLPA